MQKHGHTLVTIAGDRGELRTGSEADDKSAVRRAARRRRAAVDWVAVGPAVRVHLARWLVDRPPTTVLLYLATAREASVEELAVVGGLRHRWAVPRLGADDQLTAHPLDGPMEQHRIGFRQPAAGSPPVTDPEIGVVLVPGVAFDRWGGRLGQGGGHYDRLLARLGAGPGPVRVGVTVDALVADDPLPRAAHDIAVQLLATESGVHRVLGGG